MIILEVSLGLGDMVLMDAIIIALIGVGGAVLATLLGVMFQDFRANRKVQIMIGTEDGLSLTGQHKKTRNLLQQNYGSTKELVQLGLIESKEIHNKINDLREKFIRESDEGTRRHNNLNDQQKEIKNHLNVVQDLVKDWEQINFNYNKLQKEHLKLQSQYDHLLLRYKTLTEDQSFNEEVEIGG